MTKNSSIPFVHVANFTLCGHRSGNGVAVAVVVPVPFHSILPLKKVTGFSFGQRTLVELSSHIGGCVGRQQPGRETVTLTLWDVAVSRWWLLAGIESLITAIVFARVCGAISAIVVVRDERRIIRVAGDAP